MIKDSEFRQFRGKCRQKGLDAKQIDKNTWIIKNGVFLVAFYPKENKIYIYGTTANSIIECDQDDAIKYAMNKPPILDREKRYQRKRSGKHLKGILYERTKNPICRWCAKTLRFNDATIDHVIPISRGGVDNLNNVVLSCYSCNKKRSNLMPEI